MAGLKACLGLPNAAPALMIVSPLFLSAIRTIEYGREVGTAEAEIGQLTGAMGAKLAYNLVSATLLASIGCPPLWKREQGGDGFRQLAEDLARCHSERPVTFCKQR
jgi:hypothetical protein